MKKLTQLYGKPSIVLFCALGILILYSAILQIFFPLSPAERCLSGYVIPWYRSGPLLGSAVTAVLVGIALVGALYFLVGIFGSIYYVISKKDRTKPNPFLRLIIRGVVTLATAFIIFFIFSVALSFGGISTCPLRLPQIPK